MNIEIRAAIMKEFSQIGNDLGKVYKLLNSLDEETFHVDSAMTRLNNCIKILLDDMNTVESSTEDIEYTNDWEQFGQLERLLVPGGWLLGIWNCEEGRWEKGSSIIFYPDPDHKWKCK